MRIHLIAVGGSAMHNIAIALKEAGHQVSGSDDEIYEPAKSKLKKENLLPKTIGWTPDLITHEIDLVILGMHAKKDNPELLKAQALGIEIVSYPEFIYRHSQNKTRVVIAGSHGKTTTTAMIMHVLKYHAIDFDFMVGAQLEGFDTMASFTNAPIIIIEGDEYLSSAIDRVPKMLHYKPDIAIITGISWDHINVFPTFEDYLEQFKKFINSVEPQGTLIYYRHDPNITALINDTFVNADVIPYEIFPYYTEDGHLFIEKGASKANIQFFGQHNLENLSAAYEALIRLDISPKQIFEAIPSFKGAAKRLQLIKKGVRDIAYLDFAHAPSKVNATIKAVKEKFKSLPVYALLELHTFSSLNADFLSEYKNTLDDADFAIIFIDDHAIKMKNMPPIDKLEVKEKFGKKNIKILDTPLELAEFCYSLQNKEKCLIFMSSGTFGNMDVFALCEEIIL